VGGVSPARPITSLAAVVMHNQLWVLCGYSFARARSCSNLARYHLLLLYNVMFSEFLLGWVTVCRQLNYYSNTVYN